MEYCRAQVDIGIEMSDPMDLSALDKGKWKGKGKGKDGKDGKKGKNDPKGKGKGKGGKGKNPEGRGKTEPFDGYCSWCKKYGHRERDCWAKERDTATAALLQSRGPGRQCLPQLGRYYTATR